MHPVLAELWGVSVGSHQFFVGLAASASLLASVVAPPTRGPRAPAARRPAAHLSLLILAAAVSIAWRPLT